MNIRRTAAISALALSTALAGTPAIAFAETAEAPEPTIAICPPHLLPTGQSAVQRFVYQQEEEAGMDLWDLTFDGPHSVSVQIMPETVNNEDAKERLEKLKEVLETNGYTDVTLWAVGPGVTATREEFPIEEI